MNACTLILLIFPHENTSQKTRFIFLCYPESFWKKNNCSVPLREETLRYIKIEQ